MASKTVAVAGGSGKFGRAIVDELVAHGGYKVYILGRKASEEKSKDLGAQVLATDYTNQSSLISILESNTIDTIVSALTDQAGTAPELALIQAATASKVTRRYIPSSWEIKYTPEIARTFPVAQAKIAALDALEPSGLEYTSVYNGMFLDYFGFPHVKSYLGAFPFVIDIANNMAAIPGSGDAPMVFTYSFDVGRFVGRLLGEAKWEKDSFVIGDKLSWNEFLAIAEEAKGVKFRVEHDSLEMLRKGLVTELPGQVSMYAMYPKAMLQGIAAIFEILMGEGHFDFQRRGSLNERFGDVRTKSAREMVMEAWKGK